jgi:hypothetical protein
MHRFEWPDDPSIEFHLSHGNWIDLLRDNGLEVLALVELYPPETASTRLRIRDTALGAPVAL